MEGVQALPLPQPIARYSPPDLQAPDRKSPFAAALLSWFVPGVGSFYAENTGHGIRHVAIHLGGLGFLALQLAAEFPTSNSAANVAGGVSVVVLNGIWSIITALGDANAYNRRAAGTVGARLGATLDFVPTVGLTEFPLPVSGSSGRTAAVIRIGRVTF
jgi:hypothetical protein